MTSVFPQAAEEIDTHRDQQTREANQLIKNNAQKMYQELVNKGTLQLVLHAFAIALHGRLRPGFL